MDFYTILGVLGLLILLAGFFVEHMGNDRRKSVYFNGANVIGSILLGLYAYRIGSMLFVVLQGIWALFALYFLFKK